MEAETQTPPHGSVDLDSSAVAGTKLHLSHTKAAAYRLRQQMARIEHEEKRSEMLC